MQASGAEAFTRPKFRHDQLMAEALEDGGSKYVDVLDPDTGSMFRFYEVEFAIACGMDGQRDVGQLIAWAKEELGLLPTAVEVRNVIAQLGDLGYLDLGAVAREAAAAAPVAAVETAKAAAKAADSDLAPGIVVGTPQRDVLPPAPEVELGRAGPKDRAVPVSDSIPVEDVALGAPGAQAAKAPKAPVEDVALGAPGRNTPVPSKTDVSLDLSDQVGVGLDDVKEAVRASKVMTAVEVPKDLAAILDEPAPVEKPKPEPVKPVEAKAPVKPEPVVAKPEPVVAKPVEKPAEKQPIVAKQPPKPVEKPAEKQPVAPPAPSRVTTRLIILFVILLAVFGLYIVWTQVLKKSNSDSGKTGTTTEPVTPPKPDPKPEPKPDPIKLSVTTPDVLTVKAEAAGTIEQVTTEKAVKKDQVIIWLKGGRYAQAAIDRPKQAYDTAFKELDTARIALDAARATSAPNLAEATKKHADLEKKLAPKKEALDKVQAALDKVTIKAAADGEVTVTAKPGKVAEGDVLFSLAPSPVLVATFKETKPDVVVGSPVQIAVKGEETKLVCKATQVGDKSTAVECPHDAALDGKEVSLIGLAPDDAKPEAPEAPTPEEPKPEDPKPEQPKPEQAQPKPPAPRPVPRPQPKPPEPKPEEPKPEQPKPEQPKPDPATPPAEPAPAPTP